MKQFVGLTICASFMACIAMVGLGVGTAVADTSPALMTAADSKANASNSEGIKHYNQGHWDKAVEHFTKAVAADSASAEAHYNLALALDASDQHMEAAKEFKKAQDLGADNPDIQNSEILKAHVKKLK